MWCGVCGMNVMLGWYYCMGRCPLDYSTKLSTWQREPQAEDHDIIRLSLSLSSSFGHF